MQIIKNGLVYINKEFKKWDVKLKDGKIFDVSSNIIPDKDFEIIDARNKIVTPNFTDVHVHFRFPGQTHKEDIKTGTASAINGGYTTVIMMPNTTPVIDNEQTLKLVKEESQKSKINLKVYVATTIGQQGQENVDYEKFIDDDFVAAFSDDGHGIISDEVMEKAIAASAKHNFIIAAHLQDDSHEDPNYLINKGNKANELNLVGCSSAVEYIQAQRDMKLVEKYPQAQYHMCHISTKETLQVAKEAKDKGLNFSCEVAPHHLLLADDDIPGNEGIWKMNPPLRSKEDNLALIEGLNSGVLEVIATDHAPHSKEEKLQGFNSPFGIIGLDHCFSTLYTYLVKTGKVKLETIIEAMSIAPNRVYRLHDASIKIGNDANINIIDLDGSFILDENFIKSKSKNTPFINKKLFGKITHVFYKGKNLKGE